MSRTQYDIVNHGGIVPQGWGFCKDREKVGGMIELEDWVLKFVANWGTIIKAS